MSESVRGGMEGRDRVASSRLSVRPCNYLPRLLSARSDLVSRAGPVLCRFLAGLVSERYFCLKGGRGGGQCVYCTLCS